MVCLVGVAPLIAMYLRKLGMVTKTIINCAVSYDIGDLDVLNAANYELPSKFLELAMQGKRSLLRLQLF